MKTSKVLKHAKKYLAKNWLEDGSGKMRYICHSIIRAEELSGVPVADADRVRAIIHERLHPSHTLERWLNTNHDVCYLPDLPAQQEYVNKLQFTRHAWIDSMIAEFEAKGD